MSRRGLGYAISVLAALAIAMPVVTHANSNKDNKSTASAQMDVVKDATIGGKEVKAGTYDVKATETKVTLLRNGKVVAEAPVQWKDEQSKSSFSSIVMDGSTVKEIHFNGKSRYAEVSDSSAMSSGGGQR
jgi:hypothetical protein